MGLDTTLSRSDFLRGLAGFAAWSALIARAGAQTESATRTPVPDLASDLEAFERLTGLNFTAEQRRTAASQVREFQSTYRAMREAGIDYSLAPCTPFAPVGRQPRATRSGGFPLERGLPQRPEDRQQWPFLPVTDLARLIRARRLSPVALTEVCLERLQRYDPQLRCLITLLADEALAEARRAEDEIRRGRWRGPLHGIPYALKDLFASRGHRTTWGAAPFRDQVTDFDSEVVVRMRSAGAILVAKVALGALAMDDQWFGGQTKNPWNPEQGSSGSSAGSAAAVAAGLVPIAIGTETLGSIVSPSHRCRTVGLRPTFGRISRYGGMPLSWTMDKVGVIGRTPADGLAVLSVLHGRDPRDSGSVSRPLDLAQNLNLRSLKIGFLADETPLDGNDGRTTVWRALLDGLGLRAEPVRFTPPERGANLGLSIEAAAVFDAITRDGRIDEVERSLWPTIFRGQRYATAVEYVQSLRVRQRVMERFEAEFGDYDVVLASDRGSHLLITTNLTGHPQLYIPLGTDERGQARGVSLIGRLYDEGRLCALGQAMCRRHGFYRERPAGF
ncbi:MAG: amidase [Fimbriimonadaceae bacterium]